MRGEDDTGTRPISLTVRCTACGEDRPVSADPCPSCGAGAYRDAAQDDALVDDRPPFE
jgi:rRNA maturation endonuclease Nob1